MSCDSRRRGYWRAAVAPAGPLTTVLGAGAAARAGRRLEATYDTALHRARRYPAPPTPTETAAAARLWDQWDSTGIPRPYHPPATAPAAESLRAYAAVQGVMEAVQAGTWPPPGTDPADPAQAPPCANPWANRQVWHAAQAAGDVPQMVVALNQGGQAWQTATPAELVGLRAEVQPSPGGRLGNCPRCGRFYAPATGCRACPGSLEAMPLAARYALAHATIRPTRDPPHWPAAQLGDYLAAGWRAPTLRAWLYAQVPWSRLQDAGLIALRPTDLVGAIPADAPATWATARRQGRVPVPPTGLPVLVDPAGLGAAEALGQLEFQETPAGVVEAYWSYPDGSNGWAAMYDPAPRHGEPASGGVPAAATAATWVQIALHPTTPLEHAFQTDLSAALLTDGSLLALADAAGLVAASRPPVPYQEDWAVARCPDCRRYAGSHHRCPTGTGASGAEWDSTGAPDPDPGGEEGRPAVGGPAAVIPAPDLALREAEPPRPTPPVPDLSPAAAAGLGGAGRLPPATCPQCGQFLAATTPHLCPVGAAIAAGIGDYRQSSAPPPAPTPGPTPGLTWTLPADPAGWVHPLRASLHEITHYHTLQQAYLGAGLAGLTPTDADALYEYSVRRYQTALARLASATYADRTGEGAFWPALQEAETRRIRLGELEAARAAAGYPVGGWPDPTGITETADQIALAHLTARASPSGSGDPLAESGRGVPATPRPALALIDPPLDPAAAHEPLYVRLPPGRRAARLRASIAASAYPIGIYDEQQPPGAGSLVLNWGDRAWNPPAGLRVLNDPAAVAGVSDKLQCLAALGDLAPRTYLDPAAARAAYGPVLIGKRRRGEAGSGVGFLIDPAGAAPVTYTDGTPRPLGAIPATAAAGYDCYQEYLPNRREYRAVMLAGQVVSFTARVPGDLMPGRPRPAGFTYEPLTTLPPAALAAAQAAGARTGLDCGGVDLVLDEATGRWLVLEVNSAPGLATGSLDALYRALQGRLQGRCRACGEWVGTEDHQCPVTPTANRTARLWSGDPAGAPARLAAFRQAPHAREGAEARLVPAAAPPEPGDFAAWVAQVTAEQAAGIRPPYVYEDALGPAAAPFGVELEFVAADADQVAAQLYALGILGHPTMQPHKHQCERCADKWKLERDGSVTQVRQGRNWGGELVSPILGDRPADWKTLAQITAVLGAAGAQVDSTTGAHVHVSTAAYNGQAGAYRRLVQAAAHFEDLLFRLAAPDVPLHRGLLRRDQPAFYYARSIVPCVAEAFRRGATPTVGGIKRAFHTYLAAPHPEAGHYYALNLEHVGETPGEAGASRVEFRAPNGTLDPVQIQANVRLACGLVASALAPAPGESPAPAPAREVGWHAAQGPAAPELELLQEFLGATRLAPAGCRSLIHTFLRGRWQPASPPVGELQTAQAAYAQVR